VTSIEVGLVPQYMLDSKNKSFYFLGFDTLVLIIPWVVIQELDRMKAGKLLKHVQHKAVPAIHFINNSLKSQDRKLWGQSLQLASQKLCKYCFLWVCLDKDLFGCLLIFGKKWFKNEVCRSRLWSEKNVVVIYGSFWESLILFYCLSYTFLGYVC
jgi:hypothetical protein